MNFRIFHTSRDLRTALHNAIARVASGALVPHVGIVGSPGETGWLLDLLETIPGLKVAGHPADLIEEISLRTELSPAASSDLGEPLDLVCVVGAKPESFPEWYEYARSIFVVPVDQEGISSWTGSEILRAWFFLGERQWDQMLRSRSGEAEDDGSGDDIS